MHWTTSQLDIPNRDIFCVQVLGPESSWKFNDTGTEHFDVLDFLSTLEGASRLSMHKSAKKHPEVEYLKCPI